MGKKLILHSGGADSLACMLDYGKYGYDNIISLGFNYGQRHFKMENAAATRFCIDHKIPRKVLTVPIDQIGGCSLIDHTIPVTTDMDNQRSTVVPQRNGIFLMIAAAFAEVNDCDTIVHGACAEDHAAYRDCRDAFFRFMENVIQAGRKDPKRGCEHISKYDSPWTDRQNLDIIIDTPLIEEKKEDTVKRIVETHGSDIYKYSYSCYNGLNLACGTCPACIERINAFKANDLKDPILYSIKINWGKSPQIFKNIKRMIKNDN